MKAAAALPIAALLAAAALAPGAGASAAGDLQSVLRDYSRDERITPCRFTLGQLKSSRKQISEDVETYAKGIRGALVREIKRWRAGRCKGRGPRSIRLRIVAVKAAGGVDVEAVTIRNTGRRTLRLRGVALRDGADHTIKLRSGRLRPGRRLRIVTGCRAGSSRAVRRGGRYYACRTTEIWDDAGDTVELLSRGGGLIARRTYGSVAAPG